jgi:hypothetical protein
MMAVEMRKQGMARMNDVVQAETYPHEGHTIPDLAAVEASLEARSKREPRSRPNTSVEIRAC